MAELEQPIDEGAADEACPARYEAAHLVFAGMAGPILHEIPGCRSQALCLSRRTCYLM
jgi:hypothetical protein